MTRLTSKYQATVPENVRKSMGLRPGDDLEWHVVRTFTVVHKRRVIENPLKELFGAAKGRLKHSGQELKDLVRKELHD